MCSMLLGDAGVDATGQQFLSCQGLAATCGPSGNDSCCDTAMPIPGGTFYRSYDVASDSMYPDMDFPATVSPFVLDKYEVTVGRFRQFVNAGMGTQTNPPPANAAARALNGMSDQGGWDASWDVALTTSTTAFGSALKCDANRQSWTDTPGSNEDLPINCLTWFEGFAFCAWDGGFLPTETEWRYAAAGGGEQRAYPWSSPPGSTTIDCSYANYDNSSFCVSPSTNGSVARVGSESPQGDGAWGQTDLSGNVWEWNLDWYFSEYSTPCKDCAALDPGSACPPACPYRSVNGGSFSRTAPALRVAGRGVNGPDGRTSEIGVRCARLIQH
jgi:formylglycine-generating enzyme required for sulfatase activity